MVMRNKIRRDRSNKIPLRLPADVWVANGPLVDTDPGGEPVRDAVLKVAEQSLGMSACVQHTHVEHLEPPVDQKVGVCAIHTHQHHVSLMVAR